MNVRNVFALIALIGLFAVPEIASAHPGHGAGGGLGAGLAHPFSGIDHLLAMFTVGLWAATLGGQATWKIPATFVVLLAGGAALGMTGIYLPLAEPFIAASVLVLGLATAFMLRLPGAGGIALVGLFALFHGYAHGTEMPAGVSGYLFLEGMAIASVALHLAGFGVGHALKRHGWLLRSGGALIAGTGVWLLASL